jgi:ParB family transcriptional regulator, chromosome partitioning protein
MKKGLGKGLANIYGDELYDVIEELEQSGPSNTIAIDKIRPNPYQPRKTFDETGLQELAKSIEIHGIFTPLLVRNSLNGYELIAGERRLRAAKIAGLTSVPAIVVEFNDQQMMEICLLENIQRENLNVIEEAQAYQKMIEQLNYTQELLAQRMNKSRTHITNLLRLLRLPSSVQNLVTEGKLSMGQVRPLITLEEEYLIKDVANQIMKEDLSARQVEKLLQELKKDPQPKHNPTSNHDYDSVKKLLQNKLQTEVKVDHKQIVIRYDGDDDLNRILELINCLED